MRKLFIILLAVALLCGCTDTPPPDTTISPTVAPTSELPPTDSQPPAVTSSPPLPVPPSLTRRVSVNLSLYADDIRDAVLISDGNWGLLSYDKDADQYVMVRTGDDYSLSMYAEYIVESFELIDGNLVGTFFQYGDGERINRTRVTMTADDFVMEQIDDQSEDGYILGNGVTIVSDGSLYMVSGSGTRTKILASNDSPVMENYDGYTLFDALDDSRFIYTHWIHEGVAGWGVYNTANGEDTYFPGDESPWGVRGEVIFVSENVHSKGLSLSAYDAATLQPLSLPEGLYDAIQLRIDQLIVAVHYLDISPDGQKLAAMWTVGDYDHARYELEIFELSSGLSIESFSIEHEEITCSASDIEFLTDNLLFINGTAFYQRDYTVMLIPIA